MQRIVEETPPPPSYVDRSYPAGARADRDAGAGEAARAIATPDATEMMLDLDRFLEQGERVTNRHLATHLQALWAEDVVVSAGGVRQARAFDDDEGPPTATRDSTARWTSIAPWRRGGRRTGARPA